LILVRRKNALVHIFNAYPSPTLIQLNKTSSDDYTIDAIWLIESNQMGLTNVTFCLDIFYADDSSTSHQWPLNILLTQPKRLVDKLFYIIIPFIVVSISILMGILLDPKCMTEIVKKPTPLIVGFVAQYGLMPFLAMAIAKIFHYTPLNSLALFVIGCCPGSGASNQWTVLFDGDVNLSAVMSFVSTATSFIMMPLYFYTIGTYYMDELAIKVPFWGLARSLALVVVPYTIGIIISHFSSKARAYVEKLIKPMMIFLMVFFLTFGLVVNWYLFTMIDLYTALTAPLLPFLGFIIGALLAKISCLSWSHVKTIGIEAGIQNTGIAFMIIMYSFPQPYATQAMIVPLVVGILTNKPLWVILIVRNQIRKYKKGKELAKTSMIDETLIINNDKPYLNNEEDNKKANGVEKMQKL
jgi:bile acid transporter